MPLAGVAGRVALVAALVLVAGAGAWTDHDPFPGVEPRAGVCPGDAEEGAEYWGDVMVAATAHPPAPTAGACCTACAAARGCNVWVWCGAEGGCGVGDGARAGACWLKWTPDPSSPPVASRGPEVPWSSGALPRHSREAVAAGAAAGAAAVGGVVAVVVPQGRIRIRLLSEISPSSCRFVRAVAAVPPTRPAYLQECN